MTPAGPNAMAATAARTRAADYLELAKPKIAALSVATALAGFHMGSSGAMDPLGALHAVVGAGLVGAGASGFNHAIERGPDALMDRTRDRPVAAGRVAAGEAVAFSLALSLAGLVWLAVATNLLAAVVAAASLVVYAAVYTPLKRVTEHNTAVGAVAGALPPMIGWAAAAEALPPQAWTLFAILFFWQMPHVFAIAWLHREDYLRGGFRMMAGDDPEGRRVPERILVQSLAMVVASLTPALWGIVSHLYFYLALALGLGFLSAGAKLARDRSKSSARLVMFASLIYLPLLLLALVATKS